jgi:hypothetical protein
MPGNLYIKYLHPLQYFRQGRRKERQGDEVPILIMMIIAIIFDSCKCQAPPSQGRGMR